MKIKSIGSPKIIIEKILFSNVALKTKGSKAKYPVKKHIGNNKILEINFVTWHLLNFR